MGSLKEIVMEYEEAFDQISVVEESLLKDDDLPARKRRVYYDHLSDIQTLLSECYSINNISAPSIILGTFRNIISQINSGQKISQIPRLGVLLMICASQLKVQLEAKPTILNSKEFYENEISDLKSNISKLESEISALSVQNTKNKKNLTDKEKLLEKQNAKLIDLEKDREELKRREDARNDWHNKIKDAFETLSEGLDPIQAEKRRLNILYYTYCGLSALLILFLTVVEVIITCKLENYYGVPQFKEYLSLIAPIPVALALLFVFMTQINRAQRQLVAIAKYIHDIEYTEEIMQAINSLSIDIDDSMKRINNSMDRLLERHLACNLNYLEETSLKEQEDKRLIPAEQVTELLKGIISNSN